MSHPFDIDATDVRILDRLRANAREPAAIIARHVNLTQSAVSRRIARLEESGVITGYTVVVDDDLLSAGINAYVELSFDGAADVHAILAHVISRPDVREAVTLAGDPDALIRLRVRDLSALREAVNDLRKAGPVVRTKTHIVIGRWHDSDRPPDPLTS